MNFSLLVLAVVFVLIAVRRIGRFRLAMWQVMLAGATAVLGLGEITPGAALHAIDVDVMLFLFGMFIVGRALIASGYLYVLADRLLIGVQSSSTLLLAVMMGGGLGAALLMNDTLAIIAAPLMLRLAQDYRVNAKPLLFGLAFAITIGSVMSPIGNPQNLLIAVGGGLADPFGTFLYALAVPTLINLLIAYALLRMRFRTAFTTLPVRRHTALPSDPALARLTQIALWVLVLLVAVKIVLIGFNLGPDFRLSYIALAAAALLLLLSPRRLALVREIDWPTLIFFAAMFVLMASVWQSGFFQARMGALALDLAAPHTVLAISLVLSQLVSNVPLVALYLPLLEQAGATTPALMALAAGSTIAGNVLILGAASNVIIVQQAERIGVEIGFCEFARVGIPLALLNAAVYAIYLYWLYGW